MHASSMPASACSAPCMQDTGPFQPHPWQDQGHNHHAWTQTQTPARCVKPLLGLQEPTVNAKVCRKCSVTKAASEFYRNKTNPDGLYNQCKVCFSQDATVRRERMPPVEQRQASEKVCKRCGQLKSAAEFYKNKLMADGLYSHCKVQPVLPCSQHRSAGASLWPMGCVATAVVSLCCQARLEARGLIQLHAVCNCNRRYRHQAACRYCLEYSNCMDRMHCRAAGLVLTAWSGRAAVLRQEPRQAGAGGGHRPPAA